MSEILHSAWWAQAGKRALRSALVALVPFIPAIVQGSQTAIWAALSTAALIVVLSFATSWQSLPEVDGLPQTWWHAALNRTVRTFGQALVANIPAVAFIQDVPWQMVVTNAIAAAVATFILAIIANLPETEPVTIPAEYVVQVVAQNGAVVAGPASPLPTGTPIKEG